MARPILSHKGDRVSCLSVRSTRGIPLGQGSAYYTAKTIQKARRTSRHAWRWGRSLGCWRNPQLQNTQCSWIIPSAWGRLYGVRRHMGNYRPPAQLPRQAQRVAAEVPQEATRRKRGPATTSGKRLPTETPRNGAVAWYLLPFLLVAFYYWFFG